MQPDFPAADPFDAFAAWFAEAQASEPADPNAMTVAVADATGQPTARIVLLKEWDRAGFVFYTNFGSEKADALDATGRVEALFHWKSLQRQLRIRGAVARVADAQADRYFATRPRISRLGAWASLQSQPLADRGDFERRLAEAEARFPGEVPRPPFWGGYRITPERFEFWQDRRHRLHDRFIYERAEEAGGWRTGLLYP